MMVHVVPVLLVAVNTALFAKVVATGGAIFLEIYRSPLVSVDDPWMEPVECFMASHRLELLEQRTVRDPDMMMGQAEFTRYKVHQLEEAKV